MKRSFPTDPIFTTDPHDDVAIVLVPLSGDTDKKATVDVADYEALARLNIHESWFWGGRPDGGGSVRCTLSPTYKSLGVARLILQLRKEIQPLTIRQKPVVRYRDGNPLNMRRQNLKAAKGRKSRNIEQAALDWAYGTTKKA